MKLLVSTLALSKDGFCIALGVSGHGSLGNGHSLDGSAWILEFTACCMVLFLEIMSS